MNCREACGIRWEIVCKFFRLLAELFGIGNTASTERLDDAQKVFEFL